jgi:imidazoleglycerol-phosphate dehydratase
VRTGTAARKTSETDVKVAINLDGSGVCDTKTGVGFLDHMLSLFSRHGRFDLTVECRGDTAVDDHHSVEDVGICLGAAFSTALGDKSGINRYGHSVIPMDESLVMTAVDISGRAFLAFSVELPAGKVGTFDTELVKEFLLGFVRKAEVTLHVKQLAGENTHHIIEAIFKSLARSLRDASSVDATLGGEIPSTKGVL